MYTNIERPAIDRNRREQINPMPPAAPLPALKLEETRTNPLNPRKSTIDITIYSTITMGWMIIYILRLDLSRHTPVKPI